MFRYIFLFFPLCSFGQLSEDSLRQVAKTYYEKDIIIVSNLKGLQSQIVENIQERCIGCFSSFKIFIADFHFKEGCSQADGINSYPKMYFINSFTGFKENMINPKNLENAVNSAEIEVTNLDKCYLYLIAALEKLNTITPPTTYNSSITRNSLFLSDTTYFFKYYNNLHLNDIKEIENKKYIYKSGTSSIYMYASELEGYIEKTYRFRFIFKRKKLKKISCKVVKIQDYFNGATIYSRRNR